VLYGTELPPRISRDLLTCAVAYWIQEEALGGVKLSRHRAHQTHPWLDRCQLFLTFILGPSSVVLCGWSRLPSWPIFEAVSKTGVGSIPSSQLNPLEFIGWFSISRLFEKLGREFALS
jgi:hypothetical protein